MSFYQYSLLVICPYLSGKANQDDRPGQSRIFLVQVVVRQWGDFYKDTQSTALYLNEEILLIYGSAQQNIIGTNEKGNTRSSKEQLNIISFSLRMALKLTIFFEVSVLMVTNVPQNWISTPKTAFQAISSIEGSSKQPNELFETTSTYRKTKGIQSQVRV